MALSRNVFEIFDAKEYNDLEIYKRRAVTAQAARSRCT